MLDNHVVSSHTKVWNHGLMEGCFICMGLQFHGPCSGRGILSRPGWRQMSCCAGCAWFWHRSRIHPRYPLDPSGNLTVCYWKWPFIVDLPTKTDDFHSYVNVYQRVHPGYDTSLLFWNAAQKCETQSGSWNIAATPFKSLWEHSVQIASKKSHVTCAV